MPSFLDQIGLAILRSIGDTPDRYPAYRGAGHSLGAQIAAASATTMPEIARRFATQMPLTARAGASELGTALVPPIRALGDGARAVGPVIAEQTASTSLQSFLAELQPRAPMLVQEAERLVERTTYGLASNAEHVGVVSSAAVMSTAAILGMTCLVSVGAGILVGSSLARR